jgi:uracil-DNA glycosylase family 4
MLKRDPDCTRCKLYKTADFVCLLGQGPKKTDVMVIGEAPGRREDASGKAFVGRSGQFLEHKLEDQNFEREDIFITNAVSCRPPDNRTPSKGEIKACRYWLDHQMQHADPKYVLLLGNVPLQSVTGSGGITKKRGKPFEQDGRIYLPTYHPSYVQNYDPAAEAIFERDLKLFRDIVDRGGVPRERLLAYEIVDTWDKVDDLIHDLRNTSIASLDIETNCLYPWPSKNIVKGKRGGIVARPNPKINTIGFGTSRHQWIIPIDHDETPWSKRDIEKIIKRIARELEGIQLVAHNGKFDFLWIWVHLGVNWGEFLDFDTMLAHYILDENDGHELKYLAQLLCGAPDWDIGRDDKQGGPLKKLALYQAHDLFYTRQLRFILAKKLREDGDIKLVFDEIMMPCARLFIEVEYDGVCIDTSKMDIAETYLRGELAAAEKEMKKFGDLENWGSRDQLAKLLFGRKRDGGLGIDIIEKTKSGKAGTSESVIKRIDHPIAGAILKYRGARQQLSFFIDGWKPFMRRMGTAVYLHPSFKLHGTVTGRLSCEHPNLQQVPRDERIRSLIVAPPGWVFVECDLSQIELRIAAELANERTMLQYFRDGVDVHWATALREIARGGGQRDLVLDTARTYQQNKKLSYADCIDILLEMGADSAIEIRKEWKELRKKAKAVNFGYLYGMWWKKFKIYARDNYDIIVSDEDAEASREFFFDTFGDFLSWHDKQRRYVRRNGYVRTLSGRKRRLPDALLDDKWMRQEAERQAINSPVQSFANEINLMSAIQLRREFSREKVRIVGTVHDSILMWVKNEYVDEVTSRLLEIMTRPALFDKFDIKLGVPIGGEAKIGPWSQGISLEKWRKRNERGGTKKRLAGRARRYESGFGIRRVLSGQRGPEIRKATFSQRTR